uniref:Synergin gamma-like n=1 Tax=Phallusia mammillata TaxID=59560 RepID=A0A6F9DTK7_9ASCI|nr:synergin gamma-like [Phallusia mammillata]
MFPNNQINGQYPASNQNAHGFVQNPNAGFGFQQMPAYGNFPPQGMANFVGQQVGMNSNFVQQNYMPNNQPTRQAITPNTNPVLDKHERYKLEQQRKFKNLGQSFKKTSIDSMLDNIVKINPSSKPLSSATSSKLPEDDFGDFLQAASPAPLGQSNSNSSTSDQNSISQSPIHADQTVAQTVSESQKPSLFSGVNLESKMMASLDLNAPQQATRKFKPSLADITAKVEGKTFQSSSKSANWSQLNVIDSEFHVPQISAPVPPPLETTAPKYPQWISEPSMIPLLYSQVLEVCIAADGMVDTAKVYPILLKSQLSNDMLGKLWSLANISVPGRLNQHELYILLALIALTQNGEHDPTLDAVLSLPYAPLPNLNINPSNQTTSSKQVAPKLPEQDTQENDMDDFDDFQDFQSVTTSKQITDVPLNDAQAFVWQQNSSHIMSEELISQNSVSSYNPNSVVPPSVDTSMQSSLFSLSKSNVSDVVEPEIMSHDMAEPSANLGSTEFKTPDKNTMQSSNKVENPLQTSLTKPTPDKYSVFHSFGSNIVIDDFLKPQQTGFDPPVTDSFNVDDVPAGSLPSMSADKYSVFDTVRTDVPEMQNSIQQPNIDPPSYTSIFSTETKSNAPNSHVMTTDTEFGEFEGGPQRLESSDFNNKMNDTTDTKTDIFMHNSSIIGLPPLPGKTDLEIHNASFKTESNPKNVFKESEMLSMPTIKVDTEKSPNREANDLKLNDSPFKTDVLSVISDTNSVKSLEFTSLSQTILQQSIGTVNHNHDKGLEANMHPVETVHNTSNDYGFEIDNDYSGFGEQPPEVPDSYDDEFNDFEEGTSTLTTFDAFEYHNSQKQMEAEDLELPVLPNQDPASPQWTVQKDDFQENSPKSPTQAPFRDTEMERRIIETLSSKDKHLNTSGKDQPTQPDVYIDQWERCLSACYNVISNTNEILSAIESPSVCTEVVSSSKGSKFLADLGEVYAVACKIFQSAQHWNLEREASKHLHKQIQLAWNNLLSFCPNAPVNDSHDELSTEKTEACGVCLLAIKQDNISYGGSSYHATCANFWINCVASTLPSLHLPTPTT